MRYYKYYNRIRRKRTKKVHKESIRKGEYIRKRVKAEIAKE